MKLSAVPLCRHPLSFPATIPLHTRIYAGKLVASVLELLQLFGQLKTLEPPGALDLTVRTPVD